MSFSGNIGDFLDKRAAIEVKTAVARKRISLLLDAGSFMEVGAFISGRPTEFCSEYAPAEGVVTGWGTIDGSPVCVFAQDSEALGGAVSEMQAKKISALYDYALKTGVPVVGIFDSKGAKIAEGVDALGGYAKIISKAGLASGVIPQIAVISGICGGAAAIAASCFDFIISVDSGEFYMHSPTVVAATLGMPETSAKGKSSAENGVADFYAADDAEAAAIVKALLSYLPANNSGDKNYCEETDDINRTLDLNVLDSGDPRAITSQIADSGVFFEVGAAYAGSSVTGFVRLDGETVGVLAAVGALSKEAVEKAARFVSFCDGFGISILTVVNSEGFEISPEFENKGGIAAAASLAIAYANASTAMITLVTGSATGSAYVVLAPKGLGADVTFAWPKAVIGALTPEAAVAMFGSEELSKAEDPIAARSALTAKYTEILLAPYEAAKRGYIDEIIDPAETRQAVIYALGLMSTKNID